MEVKTTTNYDMFKTLGGNRDLDERHLRRLGASIASNPDALQFSPILVNKNMEIIDGQHRFEVSKRLGLPIHYLQSTDAGLEDVIAMNTNSKNWGPNDYAKSYATQGRADYKLYLELQERFGASHTLLLSYCDTSGSSSLNQLFKEGRFNVKDLGQTVANLIRFQDAREFYPRNSVGFARAMKIAMMTPGYDHRRLLRKLEERAWTIPPVNTVRDNLREIETVYNYGYGELNRMRFEMPKINQANENRRRPDGKFGAVDEVVTEARSRIVEAAEEISA